MKKTALHECHIEQGAKMGAFAGYDMPLNYKEGVIQEHEWVRSNAGIFDVSHMGQIIIEGEGAASFWEKLTPSFFQKAAHGLAKYTVLTNKEGGIIDDLIVTRMEDNKFFAVINAGCKDKDIAWIKDNLEDGLTLTILDDRSLIALQGAKAEEILRDVLKIEASDLKYMRMMDAKTPCGADCFVSRLGYTGEDGFELSVPNDIAANVWNALLAHDDVKPIGLVARDTLRLEMGYPLYGHDIDAETSPIEADLSWVVSKSNDRFFGAGRVLKEKESGAVARKRVGVKLVDKGMAREGAELLNADGAVIGKLTSGSFSPCLKESIGQGYVPSEFAHEGQDIFVNVRGRHLKAVVASMPFITPKTKNAKK